MSEAEFIELIKLNRRTIVYVCNKYCSERTDHQEDLIQEIILETWRSIKNFKKQCTFSTWVYNIARNVCVSFARKQKNIIRFEDIDKYVNVIANEPYNEELLKQFCEAKRYNAVLDTIKEPYRTIFDMYAHGASFKDLEKRFGINEIALRVKIHRIKKCLQANKTIAAID